jgi:hypothetical protein
MRVTITYRSTSKTHELVYSLLAINYIKNNEEIKNKCRINIK